MRRWIGQSIATVLLATSVSAADAPKNADDAPWRSPLWLGRSTPPAGGPTDAPADFPAPINPPLAIQAVESAPNRPIPAKPAINSLAPIQSNSTKATPAVRSLAQPTETTPPPS